jgi:hypothetical protein
VLEQQGSCRASDIAGAASYQNPESHSIRHLLSRNSRQPCSCVGVLAVFMSAANLLADHAREEELGTRKECNRQDQRSKAAGRYEITNAQTQSLTTAGTVGFHDEKLPVEYSWRPT